MGNLLVGVRFVIQQGQPVTHYRTPLGVTPCALRYLLRRHSSFAQTEPTDNLSFLQAGELFCRGEVEGKDGEPRDRRVDFASIDLHSVGALGTVEELGDDDRAREEAPVEGCRVGAFTNAALTVHRVDERVGV